MTRGRRLFSLFALGTAWAAGCNKFDDDLEKLIPEGGTVGAAGAAGVAGSSGVGGDSGTGGDGGTAGTEGSSGEGGTSGTGGGSGGTTGTGGGDGSVLIQAADFCEPMATVPTRVADNKFLSVDTSGLQDDMSNLSSCGITRTLRETDAFFKVDLVSGKRYHFHVRASAGQDLAVYLLKTCNDATCVGAIDECPAGTDEHFSFVAADAGLHILGIDGISTGPTTVPVTFLATNPTCGNRDAAHGGVDEHSEVCDDGNSDDTDDCDQCRKAVREGGSEGEPNGDRYGANVLRTVNDTELTVKGRLGGPCDTDFFAVRVTQAGSTLKVGLVNEAGGTCAGIQPSEIRLINSSGLELAKASGACPVFDGGDAGPSGASNLPVGEYFIALRTVASGPTYPYLLKTTVDAP